MIDIFGDGRYLALNILGHAAGILIFGIFLALMLSRRSAFQLRASRLSLLAAALALSWNLASLVVITLGRTSHFTSSIVAGVGFCALSILPSVLLELCLRKRFRVIVRLGYGVGAVSAIAHGLELFRDPANFHRLGLAITTIGFGSLSVAAVLAVLWSGEENPRLLSMRILSAMSLFLFAVSFVHFNSVRSPDVWASELAVHHGGIVLALFVILQDYRFIFLDAFVRFLVNGLLAVIFAVFTARYSSRLELPTQVLLVGFALSGFALAREFLQRLLTRLVFRQPDTEGVMREIRSLGAQAVDEDGYIERAGQYIARMMTADLCRVQSTLVPPSAGLGFPTLTGGTPETKLLQEDGVEVIVPIGVSQAEKRYVFLGARRGGRRYLSEELELLARVAACVVEQMQLIRQTETTRLVGQAELRALQAQIHPHFLFNAFNTLYGVIPRQAADARRTVLNLTDIFRYFLQSDKTFVPLEEELRIVRAYLEIEELRLGDKLKISMDVDRTSLREAVPVLSVQPLVENAVKHGVAARPEGGAIQIQAKREDGKIHIRVQDTGPGFGTRPTKLREHAGVGLENLSRRLALCYGPDASLRIESGPGGATVGFVAPCEPAMTSSHKGSGSASARLHGQGIKSSLPPIAVTDVSGK